MKRTGDGAAYRQPDCDISRAAPEIVGLLSGYFAAKNARDLDRTMSFFSPAMKSYTDTTLGWPNDGADKLRATFAEYMPKWGKGRSYPLRVMGNSTSAIIAFTDTPELFGAELHLLGAIDVANGRIVRWMDYWDSAEFDRTMFDQIRTPDADYPAPRERLVPVTADDAMIAAATSLAAALASGDAEQVRPLLSFDCVWEDMALRVRTVGAASIAAYLGRILDRAPFGAGMDLLHVVGGTRGGGFEWVAAPGTCVRVGASALEIDGGEISRVTIAYDGARLGDDLRKRLLLDILPTVAAA